MGYKYKPNKSMKKRFRVSATGKVKHNHSYTSHLRSSRSSKRTRKLRRASVMSETHAITIRKWMGLKGVRPAQVAARRALRAAAVRKAAAAPAAAAAK